MSFKLSKIVPWGRSYDEYVRMFGLSDADQDCSILGIADGPAGFNKEMKSQGKNVISVDPLYAFQKDDLVSKIRECSEDVFKQMLENEDRYKWDYYGSPGNLSIYRLHIMECFINDFEAGKNEGRYLGEELPTLSFADDAFELTLCSHFLFLYTDHFSLDFHLASIYELLRVSEEIRIFPLLDLSGDPSPYVNPVIKALNEKGCISSIEKVSYEFQKGGDKMLRIKKKN